jgi:hypothetical protein
VTLYRVVKVNTRLRIRTYQLADFDTSEKLLGSWYRWELTPYTGESHMIEKILERKKKNHRYWVKVRWATDVGGQASAKRPKDSWILESDLITPSEQG